MRYDSLRNSAFSHSLIVAVAVIGVFTGIGAAGALTAAPAATARAGRYQIDYSMHRLEDPSQLVARFRVIDTETQKTISEPQVTTQPGIPASIRFGRQGGGADLDFLIAIKPEQDLSGTIQLVVTDHGTTVQDTTTNFPTPGAKATETWTGPPVSLNLSNADIKDVMRVFGQMTGLDIKVAPEVQGSVNVNVTDMPWDQAFDQIIRENGYAWRRTGAGIEVFKP